MQAMTEPDLLQCLDGALPALRGAERPRYTSPAATLSTASAPSSRWNCWNTNPSRAARRPANEASDIDVTSCPSTSMLPDVGRSSVPITLSSVDLPEPDGPTTATSSPSATCSDTPASACTGGDPRYVFTTSTSSSTATFWSRRRVVGAGHRALSVSDTDVGV